MRQTTSILCLPLFALVIAAFFMSPVNGQVFGIPTAEKGNPAWQDIIDRMPEDEPMACLIWNEPGSLNPEGNGSEKWLADVELQKSLGKLSNAITAAAKHNGSPTKIEFLDGAFWKMLSKSGSVVIEEFNDGYASGAAVLRLGDDQKTILPFLNDLLVELEFEPIVVGEQTVYTLPDATPPVVIGASSGYVIAAFGEGQWNRAVERVTQKSGTPDWLSKRFDSVSISRRSHFAFCNIERFMKLIPAETMEDPEFKRISEILALEDLKSVSLCSGADANSNLSMMHLECSKEGVGSVLDVPAIDTKKLKELPADAISAMAIRFSPQTIMDLVKQTVPPAPLEEALEAMTMETGLDLQDDIIEHLEGTIRYYNIGMVINPKQILIVKIKNQQLFQASFEKINEFAKTIAADQNLEFYEQDKNGMRIYGIKNYGISGYWAIHQGELYVSTNSRAIGSHIRKSAKVGKSSLIDNELASQILADSKSMGLEGPIGLQHYDLDQIFEVVVPLLQGAMAFIPPDAQAQLQFGAEDFPPIESFLGLRPTSSMLFKATDGYTAMMRYDTPMAIEATSFVAVGMLLPAVQQAREAARRTQSMNNQRQLVLALLNYESANGEFPPLYTVDADGNPLLSWRVAILPYLEQQELYDRFKLDEPWDSDHNFQLVEEMPLLFRNPSVAGVPGFTDYVAPLTAGSVLSSGGGTKIASITDGMSNTILLMEVGESQQVPWSSPQDIEIDSLESLELLDNGHVGVVVCSLCDGSTHSISMMASIEGFIRACCKNDGGVFNELE
ncbi:DUF1559 domain-containing protein [Mariniblastus fucicola]|uniref:DUF1559 domain-containing protein n=1 Tax=Mariniblastus fucicola TaxID=980251 RepID=A0A5B9PPW5_9BACT|nr:DUF1559 domain-containing protein [Mariniblastus fucicola]QEG24323.1 hypothetical protein MFFC18_42420 [Mariniblastus fucicola]